MRIVHRNVVSFKKMKKYKQVLGEVLIDAGELRQNFYVLPYRSVCLPRSTRTRANLPARLLKLAHRPDTVGTPI